MDDNTRINAYETLDFGDGVLVLGDAAIIGIASGKDIVGSIYPTGRYYRVNM